jgi:hypothetical protein
MKGNRNLVLTLSIGDRPWFPLLRPYMERYARRWDADFEVVTQARADADADMACRHEKVDALHRATARYERVLYLDDTVFVRPNAPLPPDPLKASPVPPMWATLETHHAGWQALLADAFAYYGVALREWTLLNSGVMLVQQEHRPMFDRSQTKPMKKIGTFVDQMWINVMRQKHGVPLIDLGPRYNFVGSFMSRARSAPVAIDDAHFFHLTRGTGDTMARLRTAEFLIHQLG